MRTLQVSYVFSNVRILTALLYYAAVTYDCTNRRFDQVHRSVLLSSVVRRETNA